MLRLSRAQHWVAETGSIAVSIIGLDMSVAFWYRQLLVRPFLPCHS